MGHHPLSSATKTAAVGSSLSPATWMLILAGLVALGMIVFYFVKKK